MFTPTWIWQHLRSSVVLNFSLRVGIPLALILGGVMLYVRSSLTVYAAHDLGRCEGMPCFRGITPGVTPWQQALRMFNNRTVFQIDPPEAEIRLVVSGTGDTVGRVLVKLASTDSLTASKLVLQFGEPCAVDYVANAPTAKLIYPHLMAQVVLHHSNLRMDSPVRYLWLHAEGNACSDLHPSKDILVSRLRWHGFGRIRVAH